jgi:hypothetical protein
MESILVDGDAYGWVPFYTIIKAPSGERTLVTATARVHRASTRPRVSLQPLPGTCSDLFLRRYHSHDGAYYGGLSIDLAPGSWILESSLTPIPRDRSRAKPSSSP